jgi:hypothetical protein
LSAFLFDALREDLTGFNRLDIHKTRARTSLADITASLEAAFLLHILEQGVLPGEQWALKPGSSTGGWVAVGRNAWQTSEVAIPTNALYEHYLDWVSRQRGKTTNSQAELSREFEQRLGKKFLRDRIRVPGSASNLNKREYRYRFAALGDCRGAFDDHCGRPRDWPSETGAPRPFPAFGDEDKSNDERI